MKRLAGGAGGGEGPDKGGKMTFAQVKDAVATSLGVAGSHTSMVQVPPPPPLPTPLPPGGGPSIPPEA